MTNEDDRFKLKAQDSVGVDFRQIALDQVTNAVAFSKYPLSDFIDETHELSDQVYEILTDTEDDKLGRIKDLYSSTIERFAVWLIDSPVSTSTIAIREKLGID